MLTVLRTTYTSFKDGTQAVKVLFYASTHYAEIEGVFCEQYNHAYATKLYSVQSEHYELTQDMCITGDIVKISAPTLEKLDAVQTIVLFGENDIENLDVSNWNEEEEAEIPPNCIITKINEEMNFDFLDNVTLNTVEAPSKKRVSVEKLPTGMAIRVMKNGAIYPSKELVDKYRLEYTAKDSQETTFGMEIFKSVGFSLIPEGIPGFLVAGFVELPAPKVDIFASTKYEDDGTPKSSVLTQGSSTYGKKVLLDLIAEMTGVTLGDDDKYIDLVIDEAHPLVSATNVYFVPKPITSGEREGQLTYPKREGMLCFPIAPVVANEVADAEVEAMITPAETAGEGDINAAEATASAEAPVQDTPEQEQVAEPTPAIIAGAEEAPAGLFAEGQEDTAPAPTEAPAPKSVTEMFPG